MRSIRHPLSGAVYDLDEDGTIVVSKDGETGRFTKAGVHLSGSIRSADAHLCGWIGGRDLPSRHRQAGEHYLRATDEGRPA